MRKTKVSEEQIISIITEVANGAPANELCDQYGITVATLYRWMGKYKGLTPTDIGRLKWLERENFRLRKLVRKQAEHISGLQHLLNGATR